MEVIYNSHVKRGGVVVQGQDIVMSQELVRAEDGLNRSPEHDRVSSQYQGDLVDLSERKRVCNAAINHERDSVSWSIWSIIDLVHLVQLPVGSKPPIKSTWTKGLVVLVGNNECLQVHFDQLLDEGQLVPVLVLMSCNCQIVQPVGVRMCVCESRTVARSSCTLTWLTQAAVGLHPVGPRPVRSPQG
jgi:hypothetical protein